MALRRSRIEAVVDGDSNGALVNVVVVEDDVDRILGGDVGESATLLSSTTAAAAAADLFVLVILLLLPFSREAEGDDNEGDDEELLGEATKMFGSRVIFLLGDNLGDDASLDKSFFSTSSSLDKRFLPKLESESFEYFFNNLQLKLESDSEPPPPPPPPPDSSPLASIVSLC